jgi:hypothetical protein
MAACTGSRCENKGMVPKADESTRVKMIALIAGVLVAVAGVYLASRFSPWATKADPLDERIIDYVYDDMLPAWAATAVDDCKLPSRAIKGVLRVKTSGGAIAFSGWKWDSPPPNWSPEARRCMESRLLGRTSTPSPKRLAVPEGREYEVDLDLVIPPTTTLQ